MKKHIFSLAILMVLTSCEAIKEQLNPHSANIADSVVQHIDKDDDETTTARVAFQDPIYYRLRIKEPANNDYEQDHVVYWAYTDGMVNFPAGKGDDVGTIFTLAELKTITAQTSPYLGKIAGKFTVKKINGGKIIARKLENRFIVFMQYDPIKKKAWITHRFEGPSVFEAPKGIFYTQDVFTLNWEERPQGF